MRRREIMERLEEQESEDRKHHSGFFTSVVVEAGGRRELHGRADASRGAAGCCLKLGFMGLDGTCMQALAWTCPGGGVGGLPGLFGPRHGWAEHARLLTTWTGRASWQQRRRQPADCCKPATARVHQDAPPLLAFRLLPQACP